MRINAIAAVAAIGLAGGAGCAHGGGPVPEVAAVATYNGEWLLDSAQAGRQRVVFASRDGRGFGSDTPAQVAAIMAIRVESFVLEVGDSVFRVASDDPMFSFALPVDGTPIEIPATVEAAEQTIRAWAGWMSRTPAAPGPDGDRG